MGSPCATHFLLGLMHLSKRPGLHGFLAHAPDLFNQAFFCIAGTPQAACLRLNHRQKRGYALSNLRVRVQFLIHFLVAELQICHCLPTSVC